MPQVHVTGFPTEKKLMVCFRNYFNASRVSPKYWITEVADIRNSNLKEVTVDFQSFHEALKAEQYMNTVPYVTRNGREYHLVAKLLDDHYEYDSRNDGYRENQRSRSRDYSNERYGSRYSNDRDRSRSPLVDSSKLDLEIELLRKKRLLIEEERRLLLEQKKLEMIKEFGPSACVEFDREVGTFGEGSSSLFRGEASRELERDQRDRDRLLRPQRREDPADRKRAPAPQNRALANIPKFVLPCRIILGQMKKAIKGKAPDLHERNILTKMVSANLRRRFALMLENQSYMNSDSIAKLYRQKYPCSTDRELIEKVLEDVKACHWPKREKSQKTLDRMARRKEEKAKLKEILAGEESGNKPGTSSNATDVSSIATDVSSNATDKSSNAEVASPNTADTSPNATATEVVDQQVKSEPQVQDTDVKPNVETLAVSEVKIEAVDVPQVKPEPNTSVVEEANVEDDDWAENGVDWNDDEDHSKDAQAEN